MNSLEWVVLAILVVYVAALLYVRHRQRQFRSQSVSNRLWVSLFDKMKRSGDRKLS
jgi:type II secretory pathway component PulL